MCEDVMVYTDWFPPDVLPVHKGLYFIKYGIRSDCWHVGFWSGRGWYSAGVAIGQNPMTANYALGEGCYWWRGLTEAHNDLGNRRAAFGASVLTDGLCGNGNYNERTDK
jgi:hypothetical protein